MADRYQLPRVKPASKQVTADFLYQQQQVLATMQNFVRMAIICVAELDTKFQNPENNKRMQNVLDNLYAIINNVSRHPNYIFRPNSEDEAFNSCGECYELNKMLMYLDDTGIAAITQSIKTAIDQQQSLESNQAAA